MAVKQCQNLEEVRQQIDDIDERLVRLLSQRADYVRQAAKFKKTAQDVKAPQRAEQVLARVRHLAKINGLDPDFVEKIYQTLLDGFIGQEMKEHGKDSGKE